MSCRMTQIIKLFINNFYWTISDVINKSFYKCNKCNRCSNINTCNKLIIKTITLIILMETQIKIDFMERKCIIMDIKIIIDPEVLMDIKAVMGMKVIPGMKVIIIETEAVINIKTRGINMIMKNTENVMATKIVNILIRVNLQILQVIKVRKKITINLINLIKNKKKNIITYHIKITDRNNQVFTKKKSMLLIKQRLKESLLRLTML